jgi:hypothetical protein
MASDKVGASTAVQWSSCHSNVLAVAGGGSEGIRVFRLRLGSQHSQVAAPAVPAVSLERDFSAPAPSAASDDSAALAGVSRRRYSLIADWTPDDSQPITCMQWFPHGARSAAARQDVFAMAAGNVQGKVRYKLCRYYFAALCSTNELVIAIAAYSLHAFCCCHCR